MTQVGIKDDLSIYEVCMKYSLSTYQVSSVSNLAGFFLGSSLVYIP